MKDLEKVRTDTVVCVRACLLKIDLDKCSVGFHALRPYVSSHTHISKKKHREIKIGKYMIDRCVCIYIYIYIYV